MNQGRARSVGRVGLREIAEGGARTRAKKKRVKVNECAKTARKELGWAELGES